MKKEDIMTKEQIERFAVGYPYPTDYVEHLLRNNNFDVEKVHRILCGSGEGAVSKVQCDGERVISTKQEKHTLIEDMLDMQLSAKQMDIIKVGWKAFYSNPGQYRGSVVVDMVKLSLQDNVCNTGKEKSQEVRVSEKMRAF